MSKGKWFVRALHWSIALSFVLGVLVVAPSVSADPGTSKWEKQTTPTQEDKVLLPGSDIIDFDVAGDGETIYAIGSLWDECAQKWAWDGTEFGPDLFDVYQLPKLWKSTDGGVTWTDKTSKALGANNLPVIVDVGHEATDDPENFMFMTAVSVAPDDPDFVVVAGWAYDDAGVSGSDPDGTGPAGSITRNYFPVVVGSNDGASKFYYMGCSTVEGMITALDVSMEVDDEHNIAVGTWDWEYQKETGSTPNSDAYQHPYDLAKVWRFVSGAYWSSYWEDTSGLAGWDYCDVIVDLEFSPNFDVDDALMVLCIDDVEGADVDNSFGDDEGGSDTNDFLGYKVQAAAWNSIDAWNASAEFDSYPVVIRNDDNEIVSPMDPDINTKTAVSSAFWWEWASFVRHSGDIDLPMDFMGDDSSDRKYMVAVNGLEWNMSSDSEVDDGGFLFWIENTTISLELLDHEDNPYISSIDYNGNIDMEGRTLVALAFPKTWRFDDIDEWFNAISGHPTITCCSGVAVLYSETTDVCCPDWDWSCKPPSGQLFGVVMMTPDGDWAFAGTMGQSYIYDGNDYPGPESVGYWSDESAFSISGHEGELGKAWNQMSLIDTDIAFIADVATVTNTDGDDQCSPSCACLYIGTINVWGSRKVCECDSIWRSCDGGDTWLRIWHDELQGDLMGYEQPCMWPGCGSEWMVLGLAPEELDEPMNIYMADLGTETIYQSSASDDACCPAGLGCWTDRNTGLHAIADMEVLDADSLYVLDFDGNMVKSTTRGRHWSSTEDTKVCDKDEELAHDIVAMGDWVLVGGDKGTVSYSDDGGDSFSVLDDIPDGQVHLAFDSYFDDNGYIYAATAECCGTPNPGFVPCGGGVYRTTIDDADFEDMDACPYVAYWGIEVSDGDGNPETSASTGGVLYAAYTGAGDVGDGAGVIVGELKLNGDSSNGFHICAHSGVARLLDPASQSCCGSLSWDYLFDDLWEGAIFATQPIDIALCGDASGGAATVYAIDIQPYYSGWYCNDADANVLSDDNVGRLWLFNDVFGKGGPELIGVPDGATIPSDPCDCVNEDFILEWDRLCDACEYDIEIALDEGFKHVVWNTSSLDDEPWELPLEDHWYCSEGVLDPCEDHLEFYKPSDPCAPSIVVPQGVLDCNQTYWWRVRARAAETGEVYRSWWSDKWSFTVAVGPDGAIKLTAPVNGAMNVPLGNVVFTWTAVADADSYEMVLMDASGAEIGSNSGDATSFVLTSDLDWDSAYMWMVKAIKGSNVLSESGVSTFHTMSKPVPPPEYPETVINFPEPAPTPTWVWVVIALAAILIIVVIVLVFRTRRV